MQQQATVSFMKRGLRTFFEESKWGSYDDVVLGSKLPMFPLSVCDCVIYTDWQGQCG